MPMPVDVAGTAPAEVADDQAVSSAAAARAEPAAEHNTRSNRVEAARLGPASSLEVDGRPHSVPNLGFLESARMDREMAREIGQRSRRSQKSALSITTALLNMSTQRFVVLGAGVALLMVGLLALRFPIFLADFDQWGFQINCGSAFHGSLAQAGIADAAGSNFVDQCQSAITMRRTWTIPLTAMGALLLTALLVITPRQRSANF
ncbi:hypothetical protein [Mycobacterium noviomagense]|nr:hypothetical protein [Mycobacterium noviomagense]